jgi:hypothetical protein
MMSEATLQSLIDKLVKYYDGGWRYGTLLEVKKARARIQHPVFGPRWVQVEDVREV